MRWESFGIKIRRQVSQLTWSFVSLFHFWILGWIQPSLNIELNIHIPKTSFSFKHLGIQSYLELKPEVVCLGAPEQGERTNFQNQIEWFYRGNRPTLSARGIPISKWLYSSALWHSCDMATIFLLLFQAIVLSTAQRFLNSIKRFHYVESIRNKFPKTNFFVDIEPDQCWS